MGAGLLLVFLGLITNHEKFWSSWLLNGFYFTLIALSGTVFISIHTLANSGWHTAISKIPEAIIKFLPISAVIMLLLLLGTGNLYHWTHVEEGDTILLGKTSWLNLPFFIIRMILYFGLWIFFSYKLINISLKEEEEGGLEHHRNRIRYSAIFIVLFAITSSMASWDWIMSLDPHWYSTLFGWYIFSGLLVSGIAVITVLVIYLFKNGFMPWINENHFHDLGKYLFGFSIFWTYLWFSHFLLIWYSNIPEETVYYAPRMDNYPVLFYLILVLNFAIPFLVLMTRDAKRNIKYLVISCGSIIIGHWLNLYLLIAPSVFHEHVTIGFSEIGMALCFGGLFMFVVFRSLSGKILLPKNHPFLEETFHYTS